MRAREWLECGEAASNVFDELSNYWRGFNNLFAGRGAERKLISAFVSTRLSEKFAQELLDAYAAEADVLLSQPIIDMRNNGRDTSQYISDFAKATAAIERLVALSMVIYQIRCNLEHGQKSPSRARDEALCKSACPFIAGIVRFSA